MIEEIIIFNGNTMGGKIDIGRPLCL